MVDTPTSEYGLRQQALGENVNTWGDDKLNEVIRDVTQLIGKIKSVVLTGDYTLTSTNYVTTADNKNAGFLFTGPSLVATTTITFPSSAWRYVVINGTSVSLACKTATGATVTVPSGAIAYLYGDTVDVKLATPTYFGARLQGVSTATAGTDAVNKTQMDAAIAAAGIPAASGAVKVDALAAPGYLYDVLTVSGSLVKTDNGDTMDIGFTFDEGNQVLLGGVLSV